MSVECVTNPQPLRKRKLPWNRAVPQLVYIQSVITAHHSVNVLQGLECFGGDCQLGVCKIQFCRYGKGSETFLAEGVAWWCGN